MEVRVDENSSDSVRVALRSARNRSYLFYSYKESMRYSLDLRNDHNTIIMAGNDITSINIKACGAQP